MSCPKAITIEEPEERKVVPLHERTSGTPDLNLRLLSSAARWIEDKHGRTVLEELASSSGIDHELLDDLIQWISLEQFESFLHGLYELAGDEAAFMEACAYRLGEGYGPIRFLLWAMSPEKLYEKGASTLPMVCRIARYEVVESRPGFVRVRYHPTRQESRLMCLSRKAHCAMNPTIWGLPKARVTESSCCSAGSDYCEYDIRCFSSTGRAPMLLGLLIGAVAGGLSLLASFGSIPLLVSTTLLGGTVGYAAGLRGAARRNVKMAASLQEAFTDLARDGTEARNELMELQQRQFEWANSMEEQVNERTAMMQALSSRFRDLREHRETQLRGFSHDLRNPLSVLLGVVQELSEMEDGSTEDLKDIARFVGDSAAQMEDLVDEMMENALEQSRLVRVVPERILTHELPERFMRRLKALSYAKGLSSRVTATREMPEEVEVDPLVMDRVVDNLLTNAVKYTERGSVVLELTGKPDYLTVKISDTGRGIDSSRIRSIFEAAETREKGPEGYGVGLSVVVQLLYQIGGKLEVMSKPHQGTTFWAHFPVSSRAEEAPSKVDAEDEGFDETVTIRMMES